MTIQKAKGRRKADILIITPALASANNGNWRTTHRWAEFLRGNARVTAAKTYDADNQACDLLIALHARRSADSIARFAETGKPLVLVLTGTDLYRDIHNDESAQRSLELADRLVVLQAMGLHELPERHRSKTSVIEQSAPAMAPLPPRRGVFDLVLVGHLRDEKDPITAVSAVCQTPDADIRLRQIGRADDAEIRQSLMAAAAQDSRIDVMGAKSHAITRRLIRRARALLLPSRMEGGANVLIEAVVSGVPVLASRISGSIGMLGDDYLGYFPLGDANALAQLIMRLKHEPAFANQLIAQCAKRAPLFAPAREAEAVRALAAEMLQGRL